MLAVFHKLETTKKIKSLQSKLPLLGQREVCRLDCVCICITIIYNVMHMHSDM